MPQENNSVPKKTLNEIHETYEFEEKPKRRWPIALAYLWAAFLVAVVVVFGGRWIYRSVNDSDNKKPAGVSQESAKATGTEKEAEKEAEKMIQKGAVIVPASPSSGSVSAPKKSSNPAPAQVPNTGDGASSPDNLPNTGG